MSYVLSPLNTITAHQVAGILTMANLVFGDRGIEISDEQYSGLPDDVQEHFVLYEPVGIP